MPYRRKAVMKKIQLAAKCYQRSISGGLGLDHSGIGCRTIQHDGDSRHTPRSGTRCAARMSESHAGTS